MLKFFRKIRQKLLSENKLDRYLIYAVGEIILVVIGILIALQINNWNEGRKDREEEQILLQNLKQEFNRNLNELNSDHAINLVMLESAYYFLEHDMSSKSSSEIDSIVGHLCTYATFDPSTGYIDQAINSSKLDLIQSDSLKMALSQWSGELNDLTEDNMIRREHWINHLLPLIRKHIPTRNSDKAQYRADYVRKRQVTPRQASEEDYYHFTTSLEVDGALYDHYMNQYYVVINEESIDRYIERVLMLIEGELNQDP